MPHLLGIKPKHLLLATVNVTDQLASDITETVFEFPLPSQNANYVLNVPILERILEPGLLTFKCET